MSYRKSLLAFSYVLPLLVIVFFVVGFVHAPALDAYGLEKVIVSFIGILLMFHSISSIFLFVEGCRGLYGIFKKHTVNAESICEVVLCLLPVCLFFIVITGDLSLISAYFKYQWTLIF